jgi:hypothetical protein
MITAMADHAGPPAVAHTNHPNNSHDSIEDDAVSIASSEISTTSTEMFEHEPFEPSSLKSKVLQEEGSKPT